jgi:hypothetical protein
MASHAVFGTRARGGQVAGAMTHLIPGRGSPPRPCAVCVVELY